MLGAKKNDTIHGKDALMKWNADLYEQKHHFVAEYGRGLLSYLPEQTGLEILDLGCGTGLLTQALADKGNRVVGVDSSAEMIGKARALYPELAFEVADACDLPWNERFDIVFSNAVFHWIRRPRLLLQNVWKSLVPGGRLICEFGAEGNVGRIRLAMEEAMKRRGRSYAHPFFFPGEEEYRRMLVEEGFRIENIAAFDRPTPLSDGWEGMRNWVLQFFAEDLRPTGEKERDELISELESALKAELWDGAQWVADYRRLRVSAIKDDGR